MELFMKVHEVSPNSVIVSDYDQSLYNGTYEFFNENYPECVFRSQ